MTAHSRFASRAPAPRFRGRGRATVGAALIPVLAILFTGCTRPPFPPRAAPPGVAGAIQPAADDADMVCDDESENHEETQAETVARVRTELRDFTGWLQKNHVQGYIGEVGWPGQDDEAAGRWNPVGEAWYREADAAGLWVSYWSSGEWWPTDYPLGAYLSEDGSSQISEARLQAEVIERHPSTATYSRGVSESGAEFGAPSTEPNGHPFSNANPGRYGRDWHYDTSESFAYLAARGIRHVRLPFRWERLQPALGRPLDQAELQRLKSTVDRAHAAGLKVILDVHNFGSYWLQEGPTGQGVRRTIGSPQLPAYYYYDLWLRLSREFKGNPGILAYALMNEPVDLPGETARSQAQLWEKVSQEALMNIRNNGDNTLIMVPGYDFSAVHEWTENHPAPWIKDPANNIRYEAHHYFDSEHSGEYSAAASNDPVGSIRLGKAEAPDEDQQPEPESAADENGQAS